MPLDGQRVVIIGASAGMRRDGYVTGTVLECTGGSNLTAAALAS